MCNVHGHVHHHCAVAQCVAAPGLGDCWSILTARASTSVVKPCKQPEDSFITFPSLFLATFYIMIEKLFPETYLVVWWFEEWD